MWLEYFEQYLDRVFPRFLSEKPWNYKDDLCMVGAEDLYCATGSESWREPVRRNASFLMDDAGRVANWVPGEHNIDKVSFGKSMRILRDVTGEARWAEGVERAYRILADYPRTVTGNFWHKDIYPDQVWLDGLYMGMPFYAACLTENGEDNWDDILDQFTSAHKLLWDEQLGLYRHANDCSRKMEWADPVTGQSPVVWLRAEGWFLMALADTYEIAKDRTPRAGELCPLLKNALDSLRDDYDFIFIDCPPSLELLTLNALCAADSLLVPLQGEYYALEGLSDLMNTVRIVRRNMNPRLQIEGVLLTMFDGRTNLAIQVAQEVKRFFPGKVYSTVIPRNVRLSEAPSHGKPITAYDRLCRGAEAYMNLSAEFLKRNA